LEIGESEVEEVDYGQKQSPPEVGSAPQVHEPKA